MDFLNFNYTIIAYNFTSYICAQLVNIFYLLLWYDFYFEIHIVAAGSQGVPDALQKCHSWSRQLQANQTLLFAHLASLSRHLENITSQVPIILILM